MSVRTFILSAWLGRGPSAGMMLLIPRLKPFGEVTFHDWQETRPIVAEVNRSTGKIAIIGYSSGAVMLGWMEKANTIPGYSKEPILERSVELGVAYDPRGPGAMARMNTSGEWTIWVERYKRLLDYHSQAPWPGDMIFTGPGVELWEDIYLPHLLVQLSKKLHDRTVEAVRHLADE